MAYFSELPNIEYLSPFPDKDSNTTTILAKNIFKRAKIRGDIANSITTFNYYTIRDNERPEQIAEKIYGSSELDWVILITNNITNINNEWPLDNQSFHNYLIEKYGSEEAIYLPHHHETIETRDEYNRLIIPGGLIVDPKLDVKLIINSNQKEYTLSQFPSENLNPIVSVNLIQSLNIFKQNQSQPTITISNIQDSQSVFNVRKNNSSQVNIGIQNELTTWPSSWDGKLSIRKRNGGSVNISILDKISPTQYVTISKNLYRIQSVGNIPTFSFYPMQYFPKSGMNVSITTKGYEVNYFNTQNQKINLNDRIKVVSNYEYEENIQNKKRNILLLKPEYLSTFISDFKKIMRYSESSQYVNAKTKSVYNPNLNGI